MDRTVDELLRASASDPKVIGLSGGLPSDGLFPRRALAESFLRVLEQPSTFQYGWPEGHVTLRAQIAERLNARGAAVTADSVLVTNGAQQAIAIAAELVARPGDKVGVDRLTYPSALDLFRAQGLVPTAERPDVDHARLSYGMPAVGNPLGGKLSVEQHAALRARQDQFFIEDDAYADVAFDGPPGRPLLADLPGRVFHVGTFSKILCPGLRIGWLVAPEPFRESARSLKSAADLQAGSLAQLLLSDYLQHVDLDQRLIRLRHFYRTRAQALARALRQHAPFWQFEMPAGGFSIWIETGTRLPEQDFLRAAIAEGVSFDPGSLFRASAAAEPLAFRLCFSRARPADLVEGVKRLVSAWRRL
jgi:2-aminoadipate transaminase